MNPMKGYPNWKSLLLGLGLDGSDGHTRVTRGENFYLVGGSEKTHSVMQEKTLSFNDEMEKRCKTLDELTHEEFLEIARKAKMYKNS